MTKIKSNGFLKKSWLEKVIKYDKVGMQSTLEQLAFHSVYFYVKATIKELHEATRKTGSTIDVKTIDS